MIAELTNHLWQSTVFAAAVGLLTLAFRKNRAQVRYWLWLSASLKFLIPLSLLMSLGHDLLARLTAGKIATEIAVPVFSGTLVRITQPFPGTVTLAPAARDATHWIPIVILGIWACGFAAVALMRFRAWRRVRAALSASTPIDIPAPIAVRSSRGLLEPGVIGFLRPTVLLPEGLLKTLTRSQMEAVLAHELSHARRRDNLTAAIHMIVEALFWFYPLVWWIGARLIEERERACDESVLVLGSEPREYADAILKVCKHCVKSPVVCVSGIFGADLKRRIVRIMPRHIGQGLTPGRKLLLGGATAVAIAVPLALGMTGFASNGESQGANAGNGRLPSFETASIKPDALQTPLVAGRLLPGMPMAGVQLTGGNFTATTIVTAMIMDAYGQSYVRPLSPTQVLGGPAWIRTDFYQINAKVNDSVAYGKWKNLSLAQQSNEAMLMLRSLLIDRFKLRVKHEKKVLPVFDLVLIKNGPKIVEDNTADRPCRITGLDPGKGLGLEVSSCDFRMFAGFLSISPGLRSRVLVDKTGLQGRYSFRLHWTARPPGTPKPGPLFDNAVSGSLKTQQIYQSAAAAKPSGSPFLIALREQLGLDIVPAKAPVDVIVIEHIERPTPN
jgi:bla regulator protein BlaR1